SPANVVQGNPFPLFANAGRSFQGSIVLGMGFVLEPEEAIDLIEKDVSNQDVLFPYLNGEDLNSRPDQTPSGSVATSCRVDYRFVEVNGPDAPRKDIAGSGP